MYTKYQRLIADKILLYSLLTESFVLAADKIICANSSYVDFKFLEVRCLFWSVNLCCMKKFNI